MIPDMSMFFDKDINCIELNRRRLAYMDEMKKGDQEKTLEASTYMFKHIEECDNIPCSMFKKMFSLLEIPINPNKAKPEDFKKIRTMMKLGDNDDNKV